MHSLRILIALIMLIICAVSDIRTGYINVRVIYVSVAVYMVSVFLLYGNFAYMCNCTPKYASISSACHLSADAVMHIVPGGVSDAYDTENMFLRAAAGYVLIKIISRYDGIGEGDLYMAAGLLTITGVKQTIVTFIMAFVMSGIYAMFLICFRKARGDCGFPFAPFILGGFVTGCAGIILQAGGR